MPDAVFVTIFLLILLAIISIPSLIIFVIVKNTNLLKLKPNKKLRNFLLLLGSYAIGTSIFFTAFYFFNYSKNKIPQKVTDNYKGVYRMKPDSMLNTTRKDSLLPILFLKDSCIIEIKNWEGFFYDSLGTWEVFDAGEGGYRLRFKLKRDFREYRILHLSNLLFDVLGMSTIDLESKKTSCIGDAYFIRDTPCPFIDNWKVDK